MCDLMCDIYIREGRREVTFSEHSHSQLKGLTLSVLEQHLTKDPSSFPSHPFQSITPIKQKRDGRIHFKLPYTTHEKMS
ncbi:hypothetical protein VIGAN_06230200, partial [Vigna angularis var. angularis]